MLTLKIDGKVLKATCKVAQRARMLLKVVIGFCASFQYLDLSSPINVDIGPTCNRLSSANQLQTRVNDVELSNELRTKLLILRSQN
jgi:hypothetical protein